VSAPALLALGRSDRPGNVRELRNITRQADVKIAALDIRASDFQV